MFISPGGGEKGEGIHANPTKLNEIDEDQKN